MNKTNIEWCDYTFNPVTGCKRGCEYCYARRIHNRFNDTPFTDITYHPSRMDDLLWLGKKKNPLKIFVGSMSDIEYWDKCTLQSILSEIKYYSKHMFMFLSKSVNSYLHNDWPSNTMQGLTLTKCNTPEEHSQLNRIADALLIRPFISLEPLLGSVEFNPNWQVMEFVAVGAMTGHGAVPVKKEWVDSVREYIRGDRIIWKDSIKGMIK